MDLMLAWQTAYFFLSLPGGPLLLVGNPRVVSALSPLIHSTVVSMATKLAVSCRLHRQNTSILLVSPASSEMCSRCALGSALYSSVCVLRNRKKHKPGFFVQSALASLLLSAVTLVAYLNFCNNMYSCKLIFLTLDSEGQIDSFVPQIVLNAIVKIDLYAWKFGDSNIGSM